MSLESLNPKDVRPRVDSMIAAAVEGEDDRERVATIAAMELLGAALITLGRIADALDRIAVNGGAGIPTGRFPK